MAMAMAGLVAAGGLGTPVAEAAVPGAANQAAAVFLNGYVAADGRVIRRDQGGDTVSEGQAYAMLLDVATGDRTQFATVWHWSQTHLMEPDGLLAFHWQAGRVVDPSSATDADLDVARALLLGGAAWHDRRWSVRGTSYGRAILANETAAAGGKLWLVAGPWARVNPYAINPSYFDPAAFESLARASGDSRWVRIQASSAAAIAADTDNGARLPSDWASVDRGGAVHPAVAPGSVGGHNGPTPSLYSYDAFRVLVRQADDCRRGDGVRIAAALLPLAERTASPTNRANTYTQNASPAEAGDNPLMLVAAAAAARAAGRPGVGDGYLTQAAAVQARQPSYFLAAWVALGRYLLTTPVLAGCKP